MRPVTAILAAAILLGTLINDADAQLSLWFDTRDDVAEIDNPDPNGRGGFINEPHGGGRGDGQFMGISPKLLNGAHVVGQFDSSRSSLTLYADYDAPPGTVLASLGIDIEISPPDGDYVLRILTVELFDTPSETGGNLTSNAWDTVTFSTPPSATGVGIQATRTRFGPGLGIPAGQGYRLARLNFEADDRNCVVGGPPISNSTLSVFIRVNAGLITEHAGGTTTPVQLNLGYVGGSPEPANGDGGTIGAASPTTDATIEIRMKGDTNGDGTVNGSDIPGILAARVASIWGNADVHQTWLFDHTDDGLVNNQDIWPFLAVRSEGITCP